MFCCRMQELSRTCFGVYKPLIHKHISLQSSTPTYRRRLLRMNVITFETCWAIKKTSIKWHQVGSIYSTNFMTHGPINIRYNSYSVESTRWKCFGDSDWFYPKTKYRTFHNLHQDGIMSMFWYAVTFYLNRQNGRYVCFRNATVFGCIFQKKYIKLSVFFMGFGLQYIIKIVPNKDKGRYSFNLKLI